MTYRNDKTGEATVEHACDVRAAFDKLAIIVVTYKCQQLLEELLASFAQLTIAPWRIVIVDNEHSDETQDMVDEFREKADGLYIAHGFSWDALLPYYSLQGLPDVVGYILSAVIGVAVMAIVFRLLALAVCWCWTSRPTDWTGATPTWSSMCCVRSPEPERPCCSPPPRHR